MKKLLTIAFVGSLFCGPAMAQQGTLDALLGVQGPVQGLVSTLTTANAQPLIDGLIGPTGFLQGDVAGPSTGNFTLTGLLVNQDAGQVSTGIQNILTTTVDAVLTGLGGGAIAGAPGAGGLPALPGLDALPALPGL